MLCGGPLSGKSLIAKKLGQKCKTLYPDYDVQILSHESLNISRLVFKDMPTEKKFNQKIISMVEQALTTRRVLIVDFIALTKSLRYQLYGKANFTGTVSCVVHCTTPYEITLERNKPDECDNAIPPSDDIKFKKQFYTNEIFEDLWNRLETPLDTCKWDYPCYPIDCSDITNFLPISDPQNGQDAQIDPNDQLWEKILTSICDNSKKNLSRANLPTRNESGGFVSILDKITTAIVEQLIFGQQQQGFVVGALLEKQTVQVEVDISKFLDLSSETATNGPKGLETPASSTSGLKLVRKIRGKKPADETNGAEQKPVEETNGAEQDGAGEVCAKNEQNGPKSKYLITIANPQPPSALFELKQSFIRIATMMNVKSAQQMAKAFVEYLQPQLNPM
jgi:tRNA uridine 5-carbamoylmethylation protein Kti12